jgi:hypothetical protein
MQEDMYEARSKPYHVRALFYYAHCLISTQRIMHVLKYLVQISAFV